MSFFAALFRKEEKLFNDDKTSKEEILRQMNEPRPLPLGQREFNEWTTRILAGANIPTENPESLKAALSAMILQLPSTESHKPDAYFIHSLRKAAANEVAHANFQAIKKARDEKALKEKENVVSLDSK